MRKDYYDDYVNNNLIWIDLDKIISEQKLFWFKYTIIRHHLWDGKHRIKVSYKNKKEDIDFRAGDSEIDLKNFILDFVW